MVDERVQDGFDRQGRLLLAQDEGTMELNIIVSHKHFVEQFVHLREDDRRNGNAKYCAISGVRFQMKDD